MLRSVTFSILTLAVSKEHEPKNTLLVVIIYFWSLRKQKNPIGKQYSEMILRNYPVWIAFIETGKSD